MTIISEELIIRFINNECTTEELAAIDEWIARSPDNAKELFGLERASLHASSLADDKESRRRVTDLIDRRIEDLELSVNRRKRLRIMRWCAAAAVVCVMAVTALILMKPQPGMITIETYAECKTVTLPDSTRIWVNEYSTLSYPEHFADSRREVRLSGEAYFEVTKDADRPFRVKGDCLTVEVLGTKFNFTSSKKEDNTVSLIEGKVEVSANSSKDGVVLSPGQKVRFNPADGMMAVSESNVALDAVWHNGMIPFNNSTVLEIASDLEELYGVDIVVRQSVDLDKTYSGTTPMYESVDSTLSALCNTLPISFTRRDRQIIIAAK